MALQSVRVAGGPGWAIDVRRDTVTKEVARLIWQNTSGFPISLTIRREGASRTFSSGTASGQVNVPAGYVWDEIAAGLSVHLTYQ